MADTERKPAGAWPVVVFVAVLLVLVSLIVKLFLAPEVSGTLVITIAVIVGLLILSPRIFDLAEFQVSKEGVAAKLRDVEQIARSAQQEAKKAEKKIDQLFAATMSDSMFGNLSKLASGHFGPFRNTGGLRRELRHLRDAAYITVKGSIGGLPDEGPNLSVYVSATPVGKDFVALRESLEAKSDPVPATNQTVGGANSSDTPD